MNNDVEDDPKFWEWLEEKERKEKEKTDQRQLVIELPAFDPTIQNPPTTEDELPNPENPTPLYEDYEVDYNNEIDNIIYKF